MKPKANSFTIKKLLRRLWGKADRQIRRLTGIKDMGDGKSSVWRIATRRYRGKDWTLPGGSVLRHGDQYLELHINNERLLTLLDENMPIERTSIIAMREVLNGLPILAELITSNKNFINIDVLLGITLLHRGLGRIGFKVVDMKPGLFRTVTCWYERWLLAVFHQGGFRNLKSYRYKLTPKYVVITRQDLMRRFPDTCAREKPPYETAKG